MRTKRPRSRPDPRDSVALERGREAYARGSWEDARRLLAEADRAAPLAPGDLERLAWASGLAGSSDGFLEGQERLHRARLESGEPLAAARAAFWIGFRLLGLGETARATGWLGRAERMVQAEGRPCAEQGYLMLPLAQRHLGAGDLEAAHAVATSAAEIGERFGERDLAAYARCLAGRALVGQGRLEPGLAQLDEVMVAVTTGELAPVFTGLIYCGVIACCRDVYALERAREWTRALSAWCESQPQLASFSGTCRVHRAEILQVEGEWRAAIAEARQASERFDPKAEAAGIADAYYQAAEIHRLRGEFAEAEEGYRSASRLGREPQPGLALLRLAQGRGDAAAVAIGRVVDPVRDPLQRARLLPAFVEIMLATAHLEEARRGSAELDQIAARFDSEVLGALAAHARGAVRLADGDARGALDSLRQAFAVWQQVRAPYLAARLRVLVAGACRALGDEDGAALERDAARAVFDQLGAAPDLVRLEAAEPAPAARPAHGLTVRELEVLRLIAAGKTNKAIARELFLSEKTVDRHASNIFNKLDVPSRAAATAWAYEHGLI